MLYSKGFNNLLWVWKTIIKMNQYRHFGQGECGVFTRSNTTNDLVGTSNVGPCIVLFLHNPLTKNCFAIHLDDRIHFAAIRQQLRKYIATQQNFENLLAFLIGGWKFFKASDHAVKPLIEWLQEQKVNNINTDNLYKKNGTPKDTRRSHYYDSVVFNLKTGTLTLEQAPKLTLTPKPDLSASKKSACFRYIRNNAIPLSDSLKDMKKRCSAGVALNDLSTEKFYNFIQNENNATPIIPAVNFDHLFMQEILKLAIMAKEADALDVIKHLYSSFADPACLISPCNGYTPLHYFCSELNVKPDNYELEVIVILMLLHAKRDLADTNGITALNFLPNGHFKNRCKELLVFIQKQNSSEETNYQFVKQYRYVTARLVDDVIQYRKSPPWLKAVIHNQLAQYFKTLLSVPIPNHKLSNINKLIFFLCVLFLMYKLYNEINNQNPTRASMRMLM